MRVTGIVESATVVEFSTTLTGAVTMVIGEKIVFTVMALAHILMAIGMKEIGLMAKLPEKAFSFMPMVTSTKGSFVMVKCTVKVLTFIPPVTATTENGKRTNATVKELSFSWDQTTL
jgi:hypothetical protein